MTVRVLNGITDAVLADALTNCPLCDANPCECVRLDWLDVPEDWMQRRERLRREREAQS